MDDDKIIAAVINGVSEALYKPALIRAATVVAAAKYGINDTRTQDMAKQFLQQEFKKVL